MRNNLGAGSYAWVVGITMAMVLSSPAWGAGKGKPSAGYVPSFSMEEIGSGIHRITLKDAAVERLGIETAEVTMEEGDKVIRGIVEKRTGLANGEAVVFCAKFSSSLLPAVDAAGLSVIPITIDVGGQAQTVDARRTKDANGLEADSIYFELPSDAFSWRDGQKISTTLSGSRPIANKLIIPYAALLYDKDGGTWVYKDEKGAYSRTQVEVDKIVADKVYLHKGPEAGTVIITTGAVELLGIENEVGF